MSTEQHEAQLAGARLMALRSIFADAENAAISARTYSEELVKAYLELQKQSVKQHALIVQMAEALSDASDQTRHPDYDWPVWLSKAVSDAHAAATQYLKGPKT